VWNDVNADPDAVAGWRRVRKHKGHESPTGPTVSSDGPRAPCDGRAPGQECTLGAAHREQPILHALDTGVGIAVSLAASSIALRLTTGSPPL